MTQRIVPRSAGNRIPVRSGKFDESINVNDFEVHVADAEKDLFFHDPVHSVAKVL